jgi:hypothetical protein
MVFKYKYTLEVSNYSFVSDTRFKDAKEYYDFICFNVLHEVFHCICGEYSDEFSQKANEPKVRLKEEMLANDFSVAFWSIYGYEDFRERVYEIVTEKKEKLSYLLMTGLDEKGKIVRVQDYKKYYEDNATLRNNQLSLLDSNKHYDNFQLLSILESIQKKPDLNLLFDRIGLKGKYKSFSTGKKILFNSGVDVPKEIISYVREIFNEHDIELPIIEYKSVPSAGFNRVCKELIV